MGKKVALHNLGCKVNAYELEAMHQMLVENGYDIVPFEPGADIYIINTCTVTNIADRKSRQMLHKAKKMNPDSIVVAAGCYVQAGKEKVEKDMSIDIVIGNNKKKDLIAILEDYSTDTKKRHTLIDINHTKEYEELQIAQNAEHTRAYMKVQDGCNQFCSYCIIPYARGRARSRNSDEVMAEAKRLAAAGYREIVLAGIHLSSYGVDLAGQDESLLSLIEKVHSVEGIARIRLSSLEPGIITESFISRLSQLPKVCPHFHLSLQSGCSETLKRMNRRYTAEEFEQKCEMIRSYYDSPALTTDVIVGFPGESEEEFARSREFVQRIGFYEVHIFKYSRREGTKAAAMEDQIPETVKAARSSLMIGDGQERKEKFLNSYLGREVAILAEEQTVIDGRQYWIGHTKEYLKVAVPSKEQLANRIITVLGEAVLPGGIIAGSIVKQEV